VVDVRIKRADLRAELKNIYDHARRAAQGGRVPRRRFGPNQSHRADADRGDDHQGRCHTRGERTRGEGDAERNRIFADAFMRSRLLRLLSVMQA
jgi:membrane protease subunit HflC